MHALSIVFLLKLTPIWYYLHKGTMMNSTEDPAGRRSSTVKQKLGNNMYAHFNLWHSCEGNEHLGLTCSSTCVR
jgi:hypothetical protein